MLVLALFAAGCTAIGPVQSPSGTDSETDNIGIREYTVDEIDSVDLVQITDDGTNSTCVLWHVELVGGDAPDSPPGSAWFNGQSCVDDGDTPAPDPVIVKMSEKQVTDFRAMLTSVGINTWSTWMDANEPPTPLATPGSKQFSVAVLVDNAEGLFYDTISVEDTLPPGWDQFVAAMKATAGTG